MSTGFLVTSLTGNFKRITDIVNQHILKKLYVCISVNKNKPIKNNEWISKKVVDLYSSSSHLFPNLDVRIILNNLKFQEENLTKIKDYNVDVIILPKNVDKDKLNEYKNLLENIYVVYIDDLLEDEEQINTGNFKMYKNVVLGGTFDRLHTGHKILLSEALLRCSKKLIVGVTDGDMIKGKKLWELIEPCADRINAVEKFIKEVDAKVNYEVIPITDMYGPTKSDPDIDMIVVSSETQKGGHKINQLRKEKGLHELDMYVVKLIEDSKHYSEEEAKISSSNLRMRLLGSYIRIPEVKTGLPSKPYVIGLTGGLASGKSSICEYLKTLGAAVIDCDKIAHQLYKPGTQLYFDVINLFGKQILSQNGEINRKILGGIVFSNKEKLNLLNNLMWPVIYKTAREECERLYVESNKEIVILEAAVLLKAGWHLHVHEVWGTIIPKKEAIIRVMERNNLTEEEATLRVEAQSSNKDIVEIANVVFCSLWSYKFTRSQVGFEMIESVSRRAFITSSGSYNVRASELAKERRRKLITTVVVFLDDTEHTFHVDKHARGQELLDAVFLHLELIEKDYFGLQYCDNGSGAAYTNADVMRWLDPKKLLKKQLGSGVLYFRVKFYVMDPSKLQEEYTRYHFYLQIRKDIMSGRLIVPTSAACLLASYVVQSELGDYNPVEHSSGYLSSLTLIPGQSEDLERKICELHKLHKGQTQADAEYNFLDHAKRLEMYGVDLHKARDSSNKEIFLGVSSIGLVVFQNDIKVNTFSWSKIVKISFKRKQFFVQLHREQSENYDTLLGFYMTSYCSCKTLWKCCVEHHTFFRLQTPHLRSGRFSFGLRLGIGSKFSYSGKTEFQTVEEGKHRAKIERSFIRSPSRRLICANVQSAEDKVKPSNRTTRSHDNKVTSLGSREPRRAWDKSPTHDEGRFEEHPAFMVNGRGLLAEVDGTRSLSLDHSSLARDLVYADEDSIPSEKEDEKEVQALSNGNKSKHPESRNVIYVRQHGVDESLILGATEDGLVIIKITPDEQGRFGFNVKGGADLDLPVLVSRVAPNTPADRCYPKLSEGDQVIYINGIDIAHMTHEEVVNLIRNARDNAPGELVLSVKPNVLYDTNQIEEPAYQYVPEIQTISNGADALSQSMLLLEDGLASGAILNQFDQLYRKKPGLTTNEAKKNENQNKNRYRDISPYDETRVVLINSENGDYINASYVNMEIPGSGIVNRYIATQGPLSSTVGHFWQMVLEAGTGLIVMLTPLVERGRPKCHKYWPNTGDILQVNRLEITCVKEETDDSGSFVFREFLLKDLERNEERDISHMQYIAWPDHGVPDFPIEFLSFTQKVRAARAGMVEPTLVHCSAGIGRTGVLILMETALCLMEANEPVYPLDIVRTMRDQRAMMIQTSSQYKFVCESVLKAYADGIYDTTNADRR